MKPHLAKATVHSPFSILHMGKTEVQELEVDHTVLPGCNKIFKTTPDPPCRANPANCCPTCVNVAVPHGVDGMLAFTPTLAKKLGGQGLGHWEGLRLGRVTYVHHLVGSV